MKKLVKVAYVVMVAMLLLSIGTLAFAKDANEVFQKIGDGDNTVNTTGITTLAAKGFTLVTTFGMIISVGVLLWVGINYMLKSPEAKADYNKTLIQYIIGAVLVFSACGIAKLIYNFTSTVASSV